MINIAIVDKNNNLELCNQIKSFYNAELDVSIDEYSRDNIELYKAIFVVCDKQREYESIGRNIRNCSRKIPIIFVADDYCYAAEAFRIHAYAYIIKTELEGRLVEILNELSADDESNKIEIRENGSLYVLRESDIVYLIIIDKNKVLIRLNSGKEIVVNEGLGSIAHRIKSINFFRSHNGCIVNINYIYRISDKSEIFMKDGSYCPLSQRRNTQLKKILLKIR